MILVGRRRYSYLQVYGSLFRHKLQNFHGSVHLSSCNMLLRAQIHGRIKKAILDEYPSSALPWLPEDPSDICRFFPFYPIVYLSL
jgi:hypothetical protein